MNRHLARDKIACAEDAAGSLAFKNNAEVKSVFRAVLCRPESGLCTAWLIG